MTRNKRGKSIHGWLVIDKPKGITSFSVVYKVRRALKAKKVGHGGTLDPMATGILPLAFGEATKTIPYIFDGLKEYTFTIRWGQGRDTDDADGAVTAVSIKRPGKDQITSILPSFTGNIKQVPPTYSAVKVDGRRAYDLARCNQVTKLKEKSIFIKELELVEILDEDNARFRVVSGKGAYVRGLARDIAIALGTRGHLVELRRTRLGPFDENSSISLDKLAKLGHTSAVEALMKPVEVALDDIPAVTLTEEEARRLRCGQIVSVLEAIPQTSLRGLTAGSVVVAMAGGTPVGLARFESGGIRPFRILNMI